VELHWALQTTLIFFVGTFILRIGGRKSISQMTISQIVVMIGIGSLLIQPITGKGLFITFLAALLLVLLMILTEYIEMKVDFLETLVSGKAVILVENGKVNIKNLKKQRLTIDRLETRLRQVGVSSIEDVQYATIEVSGELGYELKENKKPISKEDFDKLMTEISHIKEAMGLNMKTQVNQNQNQKNDIFEELSNKKFEGNKNEP
jgi:uncharacterized membrane protein YcaP (DUF421 family)